MLCYHIRWLNKVVYKTTNTICAWPYDSSGGHFKVTWIMSFIAGHKSRPKIATVSKLTNVERNSELWLQVVTVYGIIVCSSRNFLIENYPRARGLMFAPCRDSAWCWCCNPCPHIHDVTVPFVFVLVISSFFLHPSDLDSDPFIFLSLNDRFSAVSSGYSLISTTFQWWAKVNFIVTNW